MKRFLNRAAIASLAGSLLRRVPKWDSFQPSPRRRDQNLVRPRLGRFEAQLANVIVAQLPFLLLEQLLPKLPVAQASAAAENLERLLASFKKSPRFHAPLELLSAGRVVPLHAMLTRQPFPRIHCARCSGAAAYDTKLVHGQAINRSSDRQH